MPTGTQQKQAKKTPVKNHDLPSAIRMQQEMMVMRETDQWMCEHYDSRR